MPFAADDDDDDEDIQHGSGYNKRGKYGRGGEMGSSIDLRGGRGVSGENIYDSEIIHNSIRQKIELEKWSKMIFLALFLFQSSYFLSLCLKRKQTTSTRTIIG